MTSIVTRTGKGSELSYAEMDSNFNSLNGINEAQIAATYTVAAADQNRTIEFSRATAIAVTLTDIATLIAAGDLSDFKVILKNIGVGAVTVTAGGADTFDKGGTSVVLNQYHYITIQSDSTGTVWNVINGDYVQTLSDKTFTGVFAGNLTGNLTGDVTGNVTGNVTGDVTGNADTVTTNANLTGDVTSVGNATSIAPGVIEASHHVPITAGTTYRYHASRLGEAPATTSTSYVLADFTEGASFVIPRGGTYRCRFEIRNSTGGTTSAVIYKDGVLFGNVKSTGSATYTIFNDDLIFATGDIVQLYYKTSTGATIASVKNFQILAAVELLG